MQVEDEDEDEYWNHLCGIAIPNRALRPSELPP
jgi:hypothetical protein